MSNKNQMPEMIYETPAEWGDTYYMDEEAAKENLTSLQELGDEWETIDMNDYDTYTKWFNTSSGTPVYRLDMQKDDYFFIFTPIDDGEYGIEEYDKDEHK